MNTKEKNQDFVCHDCFKLKKCKEPFVSWVFFFIAIIAVIAIRAVNLFLNYDPTVAKVAWYVGIGGFSIYFIYKFRYDRRLHKVLDKSRVSEKLLLKRELSKDDYETLGTIICKLTSKKDMINYFFIFLFSILALALGIYEDFIK